MAIEGATIARVPAPLPDLKNTDAEAVKAWADEMNRTLSEELMTLRSSVALIAENAGTGGGTGSSTTDHAALTNLSFDASGHLGFASQVDVDSANATLATHVSDTSIHRGRTAVYATVSSLGASGFMQMGNITTSGSKGYMSGRGFSVIGISGILDATVVSTPGKVVIQIQKNGVTLVSLDVTVSSTGVKYNSIEFGADIHTFDASSSSSQDVLAFRLSFQDGFTGTLGTSICFCEVRHDPIT